MESIVCTTTISLLRRKRELVHFSQCQDLGAYSWKNFTFLGVSSYQIQPHPTFDLQSQTKVV